MSVFLELLAHICLLMFICLAGSKYSIRRSYINSKMLNFSLTSNSLQRAGV